LLFLLLLRRKIWVGAGFCLTQLIGYFSKIKIFDRAARDDYHYGKYVNIYTYANYLYKKYITNDDDEDDDWKRD